MLKQVGRKSGQLLFILGLCSGLLALFLVACNNEEQPQTGANASEQLFESYALPPPADEPLFAASDEFFSPFATWQSEREQANLNSALPEISGMPGFLELVDEFSLDLPEDFKDESPQASSKNFFEFENTRPEQPEQ